MSPLHRVRGFNLIELVVVVAIVAVLAAIAIPVYQRYVARSQIASALEEISPARTQYEVLLTRHTTPADFADITQLGLQVDSTRCTNSATPADDGAGDIQCAIKGNPLVAGKTIRWHRNADGDWHCESPDLDTGLLPTACSRP